jgi:hypothetical protein
MNLSDIIKKLWDEFVSLFNKEPEAPQVIAFTRIKEAGDWRTGTALWSGTLPLFSTRIYYLEILRTSIADKRELGIKPPPSHTFKLYFFSKTQSAQKQRVTVFVCYQNCYLQASSEDYIGCEIIGKAISRRLNELCSRSYAESSDLTEAETITRPGQLPQLKLKSANLPAVALLGRSTAPTQANWQAFIDRQMEGIRLEQVEKAKRKGFRSSS